MPGTCLPKLSRELRRAELLRRLGRVSAGYANACADNCAGAVAVDCGGVLVVWIKMPSTTEAMCGPMMSAAPGREDRSLTVWARDLTMLDTVDRRRACDSCNRNDTAKPAQDVSE